MKNATVIVGIAALAMTVTPILAHSNVDNPTVKTRMMVMSNIAAASKTLGTMARGRTDFDEATANAAIQVLIDNASQIPVVFELPEDDPKSEAHPAIWENFDDFVAKGFALEEASRAALDNVGSKGALMQAMRPIGSTCKGCHRDYRL